MNISKFAHCTASFSVWLGSCAPAKEIAQCTELAMIPTWLRGCSIYKINIFQQKIPIDISINIFCNILININILKNIWISIFLKFSLLILIDFWYIEHSETKLATKVRSCPQCFLLNAISHLPFEKNYHF